MSLDPAHCKSDNPVSRRDALSLVLFSWANGFPATEYFLRYSIVLQLLLETIDSIARYMLTLFSWLLTLHCPFWKSSDSLTALGLDRSSNWS